MSRFAPLVLFVSFCFIVLPRQLDAQPPEVRTVLPSVVNLKEDVTYLVELTEDPAYKDQLQNIMDVLDTFLPGVDQEQPVRFDVILEAEGRSTRFCVPVTGRNNFRSFVRQNLKGFSIVTKRRAGGIYELQRGFQGWMRHVDSKYAVISDKAEYVPKEFDSVAGVQDLLDRHSDLVGALSNTADGQADRKDSMQTLQKELLAGLKKKPKEMEVEFALRQLAFNQQIEELSRIFVESRDFVVTWTTDVEGKRGVAGVSVEALPKTDLSASITQLGETQDDFATLPVDESAALSIRINHALDPMRVKNFAALLNAVRDVALVRIDNDEEGTKESKEAATKAVKLFVKQMIASLGTKKVNGILDAWEAGKGRLSVVGAINSADGVALLDVLKLLPKIDENVKLTEDVAEVGEVKIHSVGIPKQALDEVADLTGDVEVAYLGLAKNAIWYAVGEGSLERLKATITKHQTPVLQEVGEPPPADARIEHNVLQGHVRMGPWIDYLDRRRGRLDENLKPEDLTKEEKLEREEREEIRKIAMAVFKEGGDTIDGRLYVVKQQGEEPRVKGETIFGEGIMRFVGTMMSRMSKQLFE